MPESMTGYGLAEGSVSGGRLQVEIRSVNHRHFATNLKLCTPLQSLEPDLRTRLRERIARGHVTLSVRWVEHPERWNATRVNLERAREVIDALTELKNTMSLPGEIDLGFVARQPDVFSVPTPDEIEVDSDAVFEVVDGAVTELVAMREREGAALGREVTGLLQDLASEVEKVEARAPQRLAAERDRLRRSVSELLNGRQLDEGRMSQEIALIADKLDITEELVRLRSHIDSCGHALASSEPIGRKLTFLGQEMLREINTIGSKANDAAITQAVIAMKGTVEKLREQLENIE
ncbi:MAG: YicC family protein [Gemmatimonadota bacterium]|nr:MAG: YicC family protein [Gemmatimonadota bacterium]